MFEFEFEFLDILIRIFLNTRASLKETYQYHKLRLFLNNTLGINILIRNLKILERNYYCL